MDSAQKPDPNELLSFTLTRQQWQFIALMARQGGLEAFNNFVKRDAHKEECIVEIAQAVKAIYELVYPDSAARAAAG
jgi:hypothetical protein